MTTTIYVVEKHRDYH